MAMLKKSRRNLQACTEVGLISRVMEMLVDAEDIVAGRLYEYSSGYHFTKALTQSLNLLTNFKLQ